MKTIIFIVGLVLAYTNLTGQSYVSEKQIHMTKTSTTEGKVFTTIHIEKHNNRVVLVYDGMVIKYPITEYYPKYYKSGDVVIYKTDNYIGFVIKDTYNIYYIKPE